MKYKTFTVLVTVAVEDDQEIQHEFVIGRRISLMLGGKTPPTILPVLTGCASALPGDMVVDPFECRGTCSQVGSLSRLNSFGQRVRLIKNQHALLHTGHRV